MLEQPINFLADNLVFFGILVAGVVALVALVLGAAIMAGKSESTGDDRILFRILDVLTFWIPVAGPKISKNINTTPSQRNGS